MKKDLTRTIQFPKLRAVGALEKTSADDATRTIDVLWYSGAFVQRYSWEHGLHELAFSMEPKAIRMGRLKEGRAPLLNSHQTWDLANQIGVVEKAMLKNGEGRATVRFSKRDEVEPLWQDVKDGIIRNVSMGAVVHQMKEVTEKGDKTKRFLAIDWEPWELSLVTIGADPAAQTLSPQAEQFPCIVNFSAEASANAPKESKMKVRLLGSDEIVDILEDEFDEKLHTKDLETDPAPTPKKVDLGTRVTDDKSEDRELQDTIEADQRRSKRIRELAVHFELDELWAQRHIKLDSTVKAATADGRKRVAASAPDIDGRISMNADYDSLGWKSERMAEALHARVTKAACPEPARAFARMRISELAFVVLQSLGIARGRTLDPLRNPEDVIKLALSTSDFPGLLANVLNKNLEAAYQLASPTFRAFASKREFKDYRPHKFVRDGDFPTPLLVGENGEITQGAMGEGSESVTALKYGRILAIGHETLINDDVNAFNDFGGKVARRITDFENATFYARVIAVGSGLGPALADAVAVYNAAHGSNIGSAGVISNALFGEAFGKLAAMTSIDGLKLNVPPKFVLTSPTSFIAAKTLLAAIFPAVAANVNPFAGIMEAISDANLSGARFYVLADPAAGSNYIWGTIGGKGPRYAVRDGWEVEGVQVKVVHDFGCGAIDYRFGYTAAGA